MLDDLFSHSIYDDQMQIEECELSAFVRAVSWQPVSHTWMVDLCYRAESAVINLRSSISHKLIAAQNGGLGLDYCSAGCTLERMSYEVPYLLPHDTDQWTLHLLQRGWPERRANASAAARTAIIIADVRAALRPALRSLSPCRARLPRLRTQRLA